MFRFYLALSSSLRKAVSDPLARFDPEISLDISFDSPPTAPLQQQQGAPDTPAGGSEDTPAASVASSTPNEFSLNFSSAFRNAAPSSSSSVEKQGRHLMRIVV